MVRLLKPKVRLARRSFKRFGIVSCLLFLVSCCGYFVFKSDYLTVKNVNCWVKDKTSIADEKRWCEQAERQFLAQKIFHTHLDAVAYELERKFLPVGEVKISKKYPQTVLVQISERKPIAKISSPGGLEFLVDKEGATFSETTPETKDLKKVSLELGLELTLGQTLNEDIVLLILLEDPQIKSIKYIGQEGIEVQAEENLTILFSREKNLESQTHALQMIVKKYRIEGKGLKSVDLRYDQPVVRY